MSVTTAAPSNFFSQLSAGARKQAMVIMAIVYKDFRAQLGMSRLGFALAVARTDGSDGRHVSTVVHGGKDGN